MNLPSMVFGLPTVVGSHSATESCVQFRAPGESLVEVKIIQTPAGHGRRAMVTLNDVAARVLQQLSWQMPVGLGYEADPDAYEQAVRRSVLLEAFNLACAVAYARAVDCEMIEVAGLLASDEVETPLDGVVNEDDVRAHIFHLVGAFGAGVRLSGFAYSSENKRRLLRAVAPNPVVSRQSSSQGFAIDLDWHQDNADRQVFGVEAFLPHSCGPMNPYQAFAAINPVRHVPLEVVALADLVAEVGELYGGEVIDDLCAPIYSIRAPESHGNNRISKEFVPLLFKDEHGKWHGRFHAGNVVPLTASASHAFTAFREVASNTRAIIEWSAQAGSLLLYSNTRCLHRRRSYQPMLNGRDRYYVRLYMMPTDTLPSLGHGRYEHVLA